MKGGASLRHLCHAGATRADALRLGATRDGHRLLADSRVVARSILGGSHHEYGLELAA
jgi:hypothetical protein